MKVQYKGLLNAFKQLIRKQRKYIGAAILKSISDGVLYAKSTALVCGDLRDLELVRFKYSIHAKFDVEANTFVGSIESLANRRARK